jgi:hypothetical protein
VVLKAPRGKLAEALADIRKIEPDLDLGLSDANEFEPEQVAVIRFKPTDPYRKIGGMIYSAQLRGVTWVAMVQRPPICSDKKP